ncbi:hypothetical protein KUTeg_015599 [Tegillarca granosa]|uniref:Uncharacterized protein n=1 Tax=Tegillarca granosa TaxID=220873 RepID=A0ABQ9EVT2_TEGGR|nr:hypothetical protein KUTeg_015599 [Tegillarca granosa]
MRSVTNLSDNIWGFIFTWQLIWMLYIFTTICRTVKDGRHIYQLPVLPPMFFGVFIVNSLLVISWLFVWDREEIIAAFVVLALTAFTADCKQQATKEIWFIRFFVQNGIAFYAAWVSVASLLNFAHTLHYKAGIELDNILYSFVKHSGSRTCFMYITIVWALTGAVLKNYNLTTMYVNSVFLLVLLVVSAFLLVLKVVILIGRHCRSPIYRLSYEPTV